MKKSKLIIGFIFFGMLFSSGFCNAQKTIPKEKLENVHSFLNDQVSLGFSGTVLISKDNEIVFNKAYGFANRKTGDENNAETLFEIASITKLFTVVAILQLVEEGKIGLKDKIDKYLGHFPEPKNEATIHHLLVHTAGLVPSGFQLNYSTREAFVQSVKDAPAESAPGKKYRYTNAGYTLLAAIIEKVSGMTYEDYLSKYIFEPLQLNRTVYWTGGNLKNKAIGYKGKQLDSLIPFHPDLSDWGDRGPTGIVTNTSDLHKFLVRLEQNKLLNDTLLQKMIQEQIEGEGYGFHVKQKPNWGKVLSRGGGLPHFESQVVWYKDKNIKVIILMNNHLGFRQKVWDEIQNILAPIH